MVDILHRVGIKSPVAEVYSALTTPERLAGWWTTDTVSEGDILRFRFRGGGFDMQVVELDPDRRVVWDVVAGPEEWVGTRVHWHLTETDDITVVLFKHEGWREPVEFMYHCSTHWAVFLMSLKSLVENGKGAPDPYDVRIDA